MCGIFISESYDKNIINFVSERGIDQQKNIKYSSFFLYSSVLSIRSCFEQPVVTKDFIFLYNGEIYNDSESDTFFIKNTIENILLDSELERNEGNLCTIKDFNIVGQNLYNNINMFQNELSLAVIFKNVIIFFKDDLGKKSFGLGNKNTFLLSSLCYDVEIDSSLIYFYQIDCKKLTTVEKKRVSINFTNETRHFINKYLEMDCKTLDLLLNDFYKIDFFNFFPQSIENVIKTFDDLFKKSIKRRLIDDNIVVFFSGGVDSILIAVYLHLVSDPLQKIFLINTGFIDSFDRVNGRYAFNEIKKVFSNRNWVFIECNLSIEDIRNISKKIFKLIFPKTNMMDFNIGCILYFTSLEAKKYSKVCYLGSGADELFGGYKKYKKDYFRHRMLFDTLTLSYHNLTRDDRVISSHSLESRLPFLDTEIINESFKLDKEFLKDKFVIRSLLKFYKLENVSHFNKKAMQYGTGISKVENKLY